MEKATKKQIKRVLTITANVLVWAFVALAVLTTVMVFTAQGSEDGVPALFGKSLITVSTDSMEDTFMQGDLLLMSKLTLEEMEALEVGDIITFRAPVDIDGDGNIGDINTHRIVEHDKANRRFVTKGDNNLIADNEGDNSYTVHYGDVIGQVEEGDRLGGVGNVISFLRSSLGFFLCIVLPLILFFLYELYRFIVLLMAERAKSKPVDSDVEEEIKRRAIEEYLKQQEAANAANLPAEENGDTEDKAE